jgi:hypothetical protein
MRGLLARNHHEPLALPHRQGSQDDCVHHAEDSRVDADTERERDDRGERKAGCLRNVRKPYAAS